MMNDIFSQAFDASGDPDKGWRLGKRLDEELTSFRSAYPNPGPQQQQALARSVLGQIRRFAIEENPKQDHGTQKPVVAPMVHLNGTSKNTLAEGYDEARQAVGAAMSQIQQIEFNARDYYPQEVGAWDQACSEMRSRLLSLQEVSDELLAIMEQIDKQ